MHYLFRTFFVGIALLATLLPVHAQVAPLSELEWLAEACLDWYRPALRDPRGAYQRDAALEKNVLSMTIHTTNRYGGYVTRSAACEFRAGTLDESWTKIHASRRGW